MPVTVAFVVVIDGTSPEGRSGQEQSLFPQDILLCNISSPSLVLNLNTFGESKFKTHN